MRTILTCSMFLLAAALPAQTPPPSAAEAAYRDAWWEESGRGDLAAALKGYLAAAAADGPAGVRAKALLAAGSAQQRLGKAESAIATFRQLLQQFPGEAEAVERARTHLRELTAIDLRQGYDEWHQRWLFSEEVQLQILQKLTQFGSHVAAFEGLSQAEVGDQKATLRQLRMEILGYGAGAVPALRKATASVNGALAEFAVGALFVLGDAPPAPALQQHFDAWGYDAANWRLLLALPRDRAAELRAAIRTEAAGADLLAGALQGPRQLLAAIVATTSLALVGDAPEVLGAATEALLRADPESRGATVTAVVDEAVPERVRRGMAIAFASEDVHELPLTARQWLALGEKLLDAELRASVCVHGVVHQLRADDGPLLDALLARIAAAKGEHRDRCVQSLCSGLQASVAPQQLPWTPVRLRRVLLLCRVTPDTDDVRPWLRSLLRADALRLQLAEALLGDPLAAANPDRAGRDESDGRAFAEMFAWGEADYGDDLQRLAPQWHAALAGCLTRLWPGFSEEQRLAALSVLEQALAEHEERASLVAFLAAADAAGSDAVREALAALQERLGR
jgi:tetratricopeptide (TPR) repeat protein